MFAPTRLVWLAFSVGVVACNSSCSSRSPTTEAPAVQDRQASNESVARFATNAFAAGCRVRPSALHAHPHFGSLPLYKFIPAPLSLGRLDEVGVEELVVFAGPAGADNEADDDVVWAAAARLAQPIALDSLSQQWRRRFLVSADVDTSPPIAIKIGEHDCFRLPAGSFLPAPRTYGWLRFTDRSGQVQQQGLNIGNIYLDRGYIEGGTEASAIYTLHGLDESSLVDGHLPLELRLNVFRTYAGEHPYCVAQLELRNPDSGLSSQPIHFDAQSYVNHRIDVPRSLTAVDQGQPRQVDLVKDLLADGQLEVILKMTEPAMYLGVGSRDFNVRPQAFEYVFVSDREIVIAPTPALLEQMLDAAVAPSSLAQRLTQSTADIVIVGDGDESLQHAFWNSLAGLAGSSADGQLLAGKLVDCTAELNVNGPTLAQFTARFEDAARAAKRFEQWIRDTKAYAHANLLDSLRRGDASGYLMTLGFDGIPMQFPTNIDAEADQRAPQLLAIIDKTLDNVRIDVTGKQLAVKWNYNPSRTPWPPAATMALANVEEIMARDLRARERFDLADEFYSRATDRFPHVPQIWFRRAHQLSYNTSVEFDGAQHRYAWVRRGIEVLLDGAEQNPDSSDLIWMAARFIARKIGYRDNRSDYRRLFSQDQDLHRRLANVIDLEQARSVDNQIDHYLVAKALFEHCIERHTSSLATSTIPSELFFSRPATTQARYAQSLSEAAHWDAAQTAWQEAERMLIDLKSRNIPGQDWDCIRWQEWLTWCQQEQTGEVQRIRKQAQAADAHAAQANLVQAHAAYRDALEGLAELHRQHPSQATLVAGEQRHLAARYRNLSAQLSKPLDPVMDKFLTWLEQTRPLSEAMLVPPHLP